MLKTRGPRKLVLAVIVVVLGPLAGSQAVLADDTSCVGVLTGAHDNVIVPSRADCVLSGAEVKGNVKIESEGSLLAVGSTIGGNVEGGNVDFALLLFETQVGGDFQIKGSNPGTVSGHDIATTVGGDTQLEGNEGNLFVDAANVGGNLEVMKNTGGLEIEFNAVGGSIKIEDNVPTTMSILGNQTPANLQVVKNSGPGAKQVVGNNVGQNLQCFDNAEPFVGGPNIAAKAEGQCF